MKHIFTFLALALFSSAAFAQTANAVVFSENGDKFTLILNGEKQNASPQTNVKVSNLTSEFYMARIDFEDTKLPDFSNNNFAVQKGMESTYVIRVNKKGEYVLRFMSASEMGGASTTTAEPSSTNGTVITDYSQNEETISTPTTTSTTTTKPVATTTTTTTITSKPADGEKVNVNMNVGGLNMGINMNIEGMDGVEVQETTTVTTTTSSSSSSSSSSGNTTQSRPRQEVVVQEKVVAGCARAMDTNTFNSAKGSISSKGFDDTKLTTAKQVAKSNCMSVAQIKEVISLFGFEETKLDFAKFAYDYCVDKNNYFLVNDAFSFESSIDELNQYIESK